MNTLDFTKIDRAHEDMIEQLKYADSTKHEIRDMACALCSALDELQEQRRKGIYNDPDQERTPVWADLSAGLAEERDLYYDLLNEVQNKYDGETRHEVAKRLIREAQNKSRLPEIQSDGMGNNP